MLDNLRVHHSKVVQPWLEEHREQVDVFFLPSCSPELNPDEFMNGDLKIKMSTSEPTRDRDHLLKKEVVSHLRSIQSQPQRGSSYFRAKSIADRSISNGGVNRACFATMLPQTHAHNLKGPQNDS